MMIGAFAIDGDPEYDTIHEAQSKLNGAAFQRNHDIAMAQHFRGLSDILQLLKRVVPKVEGNYNSGGSRSRYSPTEPRKVY
jgi:hypothetical protein